MNRIAKIFLGAILLWMLSILFLFSFWVVSAFAETKKEWFQSLRQPITQAGCCSEADCARTPARFEHGSWWIPPEGRIVDGTWVPGLGPWVEVPARVILQDKLPQDGVSAYACWVGGRIFCFVAPQAGG